MDKPYWGFRTFNYSAYTEGFTPESVPRPEGVVMLEPEAPPSRMERIGEHVADFLVRALLFAATSLVVMFLWNYALVGICSILSHATFLQSCGLVMFFNTVKNLGKHNRGLQ